MDKSRYIIAVCGYQGIETVFGPFGYDDALAYHTELKMEASRDHVPPADYKVPDWVLEDIHLEEEEAPQASRYYANEIAESKYGLLSFPHDPDQVCVMRLNGRKPCKCVCDDFPDRIPNEKPWLMG